ncbi:MAG: hypothetical protein ACRD0O_02405 [Acidimicrobiia bacterium]
MSTAPSPSPSDAVPASAFPTRATESSLEAVLRILAAEGLVSQRMRRSAELALGVVPPSEEIVNAYRCGVLTAGAGQDGVAVLTSQRLSVFERRGFRSPDQKLHLLVSKPFSIESGPGATRVTLAAAGGRPTTLDLFEANRAEALRDELATLRSAREAGWWADASVAWPGWLGAEPTWSYLGGDSRFPRPALDLRLQVGPLGFTLGDSDGSTAHLSPWSAVSHLRVIDPAQGFERAAGRGFLVTGEFAAAWRAAEWSAFLVVGYVTGEEVFLGTTGLTEAELRNRLYPVAVAMPSDGNRPPAPVEPEAGEEAPAADAEAPVAEGTQPAALAEQPVVVFDQAADPDPAPAPETPAPAYSLVEQLERLGALYRDGVLNGDEFVRAKAAVLGG